MMVFFNRSPKETISPGDFDFKELFDAHYPMVLRHLMLIVGERAIAEDVAQETFIKLYERPPKEFTSLSGWLIKVSTHLAYNYLRMEKNRKRREAAGGTVREAFEADFLEPNEEVAEVRTALNSLDERDRICLILKFSGFSYAEIAGVVGIKKSSVGQVLARALAKFKRVYERENVNVL
ncbi:MAG TPA: RNA polymerase sigma factor SigX [Anaerolineae bacterium]|nr:RNA polymerase sigma factor SigX [Anaerolineae bacterium]